MPWRSEFLEKVDVLRLLDIYKPGFIIWINDITPENKSTYRSLKIILDTLSKEGIRKVYHNKKFELYDVSIYGPSYLDVGAKPTSFIRVDPTLWIGEATTKSKMIDITFRQSYSKAWVFIPLGSETCNGAIKNLLSTGLQDSKSLISRISLNLCVGWYSIVNLFFKNYDTTHSMSHGWINQWVVNMEVINGDEQRNFFALYYWPQLIVWLILIVNFSSCIILFLFLFQYSSREFMPISILKRKKS